MHGTHNDAGTGGQWANLPPQLGSRGGAAPQLWSVNVVHFYFCLFLHIELGSLPKNRGPNPGSF